jgi:hypothetical protein
MSSHLARVELPRPVLAFLEADESEAKSRGRFHGFRAELVADEQPFEVSAGGGRLLDDRAEAIDASSLASEAFAVRYAG